MIDLSTAAVIYCLLVCGGFLAVWWFYESRARATGNRPDRRRAYHCTRCGTVYSAPAAVELSVCPRCGRENPRLRF